MLSRELEVCLWTAEEKSKFKVSACKLSAFVDISGVWNQMRRKTKGQMTESWSIPNCGGHRDAEGSAKDAGKAWLGRSRESQREQELGNMRLKREGVRPVCRVAGRSRGDEDLVL